MTTSTSPGRPYDGLLEHHDVVGDDAQWAFGTSFEDPLAGVDTTVPDDVDPAALAASCLALGDDALVLAQRLAEWCSNAPDLEEDVALANVALDLLGQARLLLARAAAADSTVVPVMPEGSPVPPEDALAFFRDAGAFRCSRLAEVAGGDFAHVVVRLLLASTVRLAVMVRLVGSRDAVVAAVADKAVTELTYHRDHAARWCVVLGQGTDESRRRLVAALAELWPLRLGLVTTDVGVEAAAVAGEVDDALAQVLDTAGVAAPASVSDTASDSETSRPGPELVELLAEMQSVARAHPRGRW